MTVSAAALSRFIVAGALYEQVQPGTLSFEQTLHISALCDRGGVYDLFDDTQEFPPQAVAAAARLYERGVLFDLLAALVTPAGVTWTPVGARDTAAAFAASTDPTEHQLMSHLLMEALAGFFASRATSSTISPSSSAESVAPSAPGKSGGAPASRPAGADSPTSGRGKRRSSNSPTVTPDASG